MTVDPWQVFEQGLQAKSRGFLSSEPSGRLHWLNDEKPEVSNAASGD